METAAPVGDIFVTATGNVDGHGRPHAPDEGPRDRLHIGHFDSEIQIGALQNFKWQEVKPQVDEVEFPDGKRIIVLAKGRLVNLGCATGHPELRHERLVQQSGARPDRAVDQPEQVPAPGLHAAQQLDEKVAALHLDKVGAGPPGSPRSRRNTSAWRPRGPSRPTSTAIGRQRVAHGRARTGRRPLTRSSRGCCGAIRSRSRRQPVRGRSLPYALCPARRCTSRSCRGRPTTPWRRPPQAARGRIRARSARHRAQHREPHAARRLPRATGRRGGRVTRALVIAGDLEQPAGPLSFQPRAAADRAVPAVRHPPHRSRLLPGGAPQDRCRPARAGAAGQDRAPAAVPASRPGW